VDKSNIVFSIGDEAEESGDLPHQLFCELDELQLNPEQGFEWKEAARWIKFEEDVENGGRWSKPRVATLSLHSLFELRSLLANGLLMLDLDANDLPKIAGNLSLKMLHSIRN
jgi:hypothetical protein